MVSGQQPIILGRGLSSQWFTAAPRPGTLVTANVVERDGTRGILEIDGFLLRIETMLPLAAGERIRLLYLGNHEQQIRLQLLPQDQAGPTNPPAAAAPTAVAKEQMILQGLLAFGLPTQTGTVQRLQRQLPSPGHPDFWAHLAASLRLLQAKLPVTKAAVEALLTADQRHEPTDQPQALAGWAPSNAPAEDSEVSPGMGAAAAGDSQGTATGQRVPRSGPDMLSAALLPAPFGGERPGPYLRQQLSLDHKLQLFHHLIRGMDDGSAAEKNHRPDPDTAWARSAAAFLRLLGEEQLQLLTQQRSGSADIGQVVLPVQWPGVAEPVHIRWQRNGRRGHAGDDGPETSYGVQFLVGLAGDWLFIDACLQSSELAVEFVCDTAATLDLLEQHRSVLETALAQSGLQITQWRLTKGSARQCWPAERWVQDAVERIGQAPMPGLDIKA